MAQLKEIRSRIVSVQSTRQVTSAMKMVSAAKLKRSQDEILRMRPYVKELNNIVDTLALGKSFKDNQFFKESPKIEKTLMIVIGSNRGLCGSFNLNAVKKALSFVVETFYNDFIAGNVKFLAIGKQIELELQNAGISSIEDFHDLVEGNFDYAKADELAKMLITQFLDGTYHRIYFVYNQFKNAAVQVPTVEQFLPIPLPEEKPAEVIDSSIFIFEPSMPAITDWLVFRMLKMNLYEIIENSITSEHGARMTSMHQATDNATNMINDLKKMYNNVRQSAITNEIVEITAGAESLKG